jgi:uncharacterized protein YebE (UPF0316 family)
MILKIIIIFIAGFIVDLLITKYTSYVAQRKVFHATVLSGMITIANFILLTVILQDSVMDGLANIMAFAGGSSMGTFFAMKKV